MHLKLDHSAGPLRVLQITDTHLGATPDKRLAGASTLQCLSDVLGAAAAGEPADLLLLTGDLADDGSPQAYRMLERVLSGWDVPQAWLPGNHDDLANMQAVVPHRLIQTVAAGNWGIILLNSQIAGEVGGALSEPELDRLRAFLASPDWSFCLVCVHHHPVAIGCRWLDEQRIANADELLRILDQAPKARALLWGHVHQVYDGRRGALRLLGAPSTCVQFAPHSERFKVDLVAPGWRGLVLHEDGRIETSVQRLSHGCPDIDYDCAGY